jgi:hypothetical protein
MDVKVEVGTLQAKACLVESKISVELISHTIIAPEISNLSFTPIISISGHSISSVNPESFRIGVMAAA